jgi:alkylation response protein AidB-like acyl-CoA dehydrogenase
VVHDRLAERALLRESVERFVSRSYDIEGRNALVRGTPGYSTANWSTFAELGWLAILIPEELGGIGASFSDAALLVESFGSGLLLEPFTSTVVLSGGLLAAGAELPAAATALEAIGEGTAHIATAYREDGDGGDVRTIATRLHREAGRPVLSGTKIGVPFAEAAAGFIVSARDERDGVALVLVPRESPNLSITESVAVDGSRSARVTFDRVPAGADAVLPLADSAHVLERALDQAEAALCAEAVGVMSRAYRDAAAHVRERVQFGRPIAAFQVVRHRIADMFVELELARAAAALAVEAIDSGGAGSSRTVSLAKVQILRSGRFVCDAAVQLHGAIGIASEAAAAHALARLTGIGATFGDLVFHRTRYLTTAREGTTP